LTLNWQGKAVADGVLLLSGSGNNDPVLFTTVFQNAQFYKKNLAQLLSRDYKPFQ
jgi:hypothetical protein